MNTAYDLFKESILINKVNKNALCCAVLSCAVLCCAVLCCAVLFFPELSAVRWRRGEIEIPVAHFPIGAADRL